MRNPKERDLNDSPVARYLKKNIYIILCFILDDNCKKRWRSIRDTYKRLKREGKLGTGSAASAKSQKWQLASYLSFLDTVPEEKR